MGTDDRGDVSPRAAHYFAYCEEVDTQIGSLLDALKATGQEANTLVAFAADHGDMAGAHRMWSKGWMPYEECYRVPLVIRWPDRSWPGQRSRRLVQVHDLAYTYIEAGRARPISSQEGHSLLRLADKPDTDEWPDQRLCAYYGAEFLYTQQIVVTDRGNMYLTGLHSMKCTTSKTTLRNSTIWLPKPATGAELRICKYGFTS